MRLASRIPRPFHLPPAAIPTARSFVADKKNFIAAQARERAV
ncbi:MAG TPA: hypothetical protein VGO96_06450 [Pyrinomonadaceae bacterium]|nr:hypothetical protein [Pyrinomonadaceae bacterium]